MLEALLPFVAPNMKLPLAILIKYQEFTRMLAIFKSPRAMQEYGLNGGEFSMQSLFRQFSQCPNPTIANELKQMQQMMQAMEMAQMMQAFQNDMPADEAHDKQTPVHTAEEETEAYWSEILHGTDSSRDTPNLLSVIDAIIEENPESSI